MQPELERIAENKRARAERGIIFLPVELACIARFSARPNHSFMLRYFIHASVLGGKQEGLLSQRTSEGRDYQHSAGGCGGKRRAEPRFPCAARRIGFARIPPQSTGWWRKLRSSWSSLRRRNQPRLQHINMSGPIELPRPHT